MLLFRNLNILVLDVLYVCYLLSFFSAPLITTKAISLRSPFSLTRRISVVPTKTKTFSVNFETDMFGDAVSEEILENLRAEKVLSNDRWQSCTFRDAHCGESAGLYPSFSLKSKNSNLFTFRQDYMKYMLFHRNMIRQQSREISPFPWLSQELFIVSFLQATTFSTE